MKKKLTPLLLIAILFITSFLAAGCGTLKTADVSDQTSSEETTGTEGSTAAGESTGESTGEGTGASSLDTASDSEVKTITVVTGGSPKPFSYIDENDNLTGYDIEVAKEVFAKLPQYEVKFEVTEFSSVFAGLDSGLYQIGANNFALNEERQEKYIYSDPIFQNQFVIAVAEDNTVISSFADLAGKTTEVQSGVNFTTALENYNDENADKPVDLKYTDAEMLPILQNVESGSTDFNLIDSAMLNIYIKEYGLKLKAIPLTEDEEELISNSNYSYFLIGKGQEAEQLAADVNKALAEVIADGTVAKISEQFFGDDFSPKK